VDVGAELHAVKISPKPITMPSLKNFKCFMVLLLGLLWCTELQQEFSK
jgi:hypothetical protein